MNTRLAKEVIHWLLDELLQLESYDLTVHLVGEKKMTGLNETVLHHAGSTDVITFDYSMAGPMPLLAGEIFVCMDEAVLQARRFGTSWQSELTRYIVHGVLHLLGYDDLKPAKRRTMKRQENRLLGELTRQFHLSKLGLKSKVRA